MNLEARGLPLVLPGSQGLSVWFGESSPPLLLGVEDFYTQKTRKTLRVRAGCTPDNCHVNSDT